MKSKNREIDITSIIGKDVVISGDIRSDGGMRVDGEIKGSIDSNSSLSITKTCKIDGNVNANMLIISGIINGDIDCKGLLEIKNTAKIKGNIISKVLIVEKGATINGNCMVSQESKSKK